MRIGYFEIGIYHGKTVANIGTLWRSAYQLGAVGIFTIGKRYSKQPGDTSKARRHIPYCNYKAFKEFYETIPYNCILVGVEIGGKPLSKTNHPERAIYLLGAEDRGLPEMILNMCHQKISIESIRTESFNVAVAGSLVMYDRMIKQNKYFLKYTLMI